MVDTVYGVNAVSGAPSYSGKQYRQANSSAYAGATSARPLGGRTGVRPGTSTSTVTASSTVWTCGPFAGVADVETAVEASVYPFAFDANATGAVTAAHATLARIDIIYVQIDDPAESDGSSVPAVTRKYLAGTAGSGVAPAVPVTRAFVIANINVPASGGGSPTVSWVAPYTVAAGGVLPLRTAADEGTYSPANGSQAFREDTGFFRDRVNGSWVTRGGGVSVRTAVAQATSGTAYTALAVSWELEDFDTDAFHSTVTNASRLTAPVAGLYRVVAKLKTASTAFAGGVQLGKNGTVDATTRVISNFIGTAGSYSAVSKTFQLAAGDYIEVFSLGEASSLSLTVAECYAEMVRVA